MLHRIQPEQPWHYEMTVKLSKIIFKYLKCNLSNNFIYLFWSRKNDKLLHMVVLFFFLQITIYKHALLFLTINAFLFIFMVVYIAAL